MYYYTLQRFVTKTTGGSAWGARGGHVINYTCEFSCCNYATLIVLQHSDIYTGCPFLFVQPPSLLHPLPCQLQLKAPFQLLGLTLLLTQLINHPPIVLPALPSFWPSVARQQLRWGGGGRSVTRSPGALQKQHRRPAETTGSFQAETAPESWLRSLPPSLSLSL